MYYLCINITKRVPSLSHLSYLKRLRALELELLDLSLGALNFDLIQYYKVLNNLTCIELNLHFHHYYPPTSSRYPSPLFQQCTNLNKNLLSSFFLRYVDCWNALPENVRQSSLLTSFKRKINLFDLCKYLKASATDIY